MIAFNPRQLALLQPAAAPPAYAAAAYTAAQRLNNIQPIGGRRA